MEAICSIGGSRPMAVPPLPPESVPNLEAIQKVYDIAFAPGLDKFLESGRTKWFATEGFRYLANDRGMLAQFLAYLTLASNKGDQNVTDHPALASQEARVTWFLLCLCTRQMHDGGDEAEKLARRLRAIEALLTGERISGTSTSFADFVHQDDVETEVVQNQNRLSDSHFDRQRAKRSEDFWKAVEKVASGDESAFSQVKSLLDNMENRDIIYSVLLLRSSGESGLAAERELAKRFLGNEAAGRATNQVFGTLAGMALRAFGD